MFLFSWKAKCKWIYLTFHGEEHTSEMGLTNEVGKGLVGQLGDDGLPGGKGQSAVDSCFLYTVILPLLSCQHKFEA